MEGPSWVQFYDVLFNCFRLYAQLFSSEANKGIQLTTINNNNNNTSPISKRDGLRQNSLSLFVKMTWILPNVFISLFSKYFLFDF